MSEHKCFKVLTFTVDLELCSSPIKDAPENADGGVNDEPYFVSGHPVFKIWFSFAHGIPATSIIAHECWHLYMTILSYVDSHYHTFQELNNEIYAYTFQDIFNEVMNAVVSSKLCKKKIDEENNRK